MKFYIFMILISYFIAISKAITINIVVQSFFAYSELYKLIINDFNDRYVKENELDITLKLNMFTEQNSTLGKDFYSSTVDTLLNKQSSKYDVFIYDPLYTRRYSKYFVDLKKYLPKELMDQYDSDDSRKSGYYNGEWIGLPIYLKYKLLYSNINYLTKHNKTIPQTWDELIDTTQYIMEQEHAENNTNIIGYNGLFPKNDITMCSFFEYLYSFREKEDSDIPELNSERALYALKKFNKIKDATSSNEILTSDENYATMLLVTGVPLFQSFFDMNGYLEGYYASEMPGDIEGIHGSCLTGYNIGLPKYISEEKTKGSVEVIKYFLSEYVQKNFFVKVFNNFTAMKSLYEDEEVCSILDCELAKKIQSIPRPSFLVDDYDTYSIKVVNFVYDILYNNRPIEDILIDIDNLTRTHNFSITSSLGLIVLILLSIVFLIVLLSPIVLFSQSMEKYFTFLSVDSWIIYIIGFLILIVSEVMKFGELTIEKCNLNTTLFSSGFFLIYIPLIHKLISNFPLENSFSQWVKRSRAKFIYSLILIEILFNLSFFSSPYKINEIITEDNNNHGVCKLKNTIGILITIIQLGINAILYFLSIILLFLEWNLEETYKDIRCLTTATAMGAPELILLLILKFRDINNFKVIYLIHAIIMIVFIMTNHFYIFFIRVLISKLFGKEENLNQMSQKLFHNTNTNNTNIRDTTVMTNGSDVKTVSTSQTKSSKSSNYRNTIVSCHYARSTIDRTQN